MVEDVRVRPRVLAFSRWLRVEWRAEEMAASMALLDSGPGGVGTLIWCSSLSVHHLQHRRSACLVNFVAVHFYFYFDSLSLR